jgi:methionyl-tRNA synthetase
MTDSFVQINKKYDSQIPDYTKYTDDSLTEWIAEVNTLLAEFNESFTSVKIKAALSVAMRIASAGNKLLQSNTLDNKTFAAEPHKIGAVVGLGANLILLLAAIFRPFLPIVSTSIATQLNLEATNKDGTVAEALFIPEKWTSDALKPGHKIGAAQRLFEPIKPEMEEVWRDQFGGEEMRKMKEEKKAKAEKRRLDKLKKKEKKAGGGEDKVAEVGKKVEDLKV